MLMMFLSLALFSSADILLFLSTILFKCISIVLPHQLRGVYYAAIDRFASAFSYISLLHRRIGKRWYNALRECKKIRRTFDIFANFNKNRNNTEDFFRFEIWVQQIYYNIYTKEIFFLDKIPTRTISFNSGCNLKTKDLNASTACEVLYILGKCNKKTIYLKRM